MKWLGDLVKEVIELPGKAIETATKEMVAFPARILEGLEKGMEIAIDPEADVDKSGQ